MVDDNFNAWIERSTDLAERVQSIATSLSHEAAHSSVNGGLDQSTTSRTNLPDATAQADGELQNPFTPAQQEYLELRKECWRRDAELDFLRKQAQRAVEKMEEASIQLESLRGERDALQVRASRLAENHGLPPIVLTDSFDMRSSSARRVRFDDRLVESPRTLREPAPAAEPELANPILKRKQVFPVPTRSTSLPAPQGQQLGSAPVRFSSLPPQDFADSPPHPSNIDCREDMTVVNQKVGHSSPAPAAPAAPAAPVAPVAPVAAVLPFTPSFSVVSGQASYATDVAASGGRGMPSPPLVLLPAIAALRSEVNGTGVQRN